MLGNSPKRYLHEKSLGEWGHLWGFGWHKTARIMAAKCVIVCCSVARYGHYGSHSYGNIMSGTIEVAMWWTLV